MVFGAKIPILRDRNSYLGVPFSNIELLLVIFGDRHAVHSILPSIFHNTAY